MWPTSMAEQCTVRTRTSDLREMVLHAMQAIGRNNAEDSGDHWVGSLPLPGKRLL